MLNGMWWKTEWTHLYFEISSVTHICDRKLELSFWITAMLGIFFADNRVHQGQCETLGDYKKRFELAVEALEACNKPSNIRIFQRKELEYLILLNRSSRNAT